MNVPRFDIFAGSSDKDAKWLEVVEGLGHANDRMKLFAARNPGPYFVFSRWTRQILASVDTTSSKRTETKSDAV